jgi:hypothetical protein
MRVYHTGFLAADRAANPELNALAASLFAEAAEGRVYLTQRRLGPGRFEYIVTESETSRASVALRRAA